jgi:hypothetical protein
MRRASNGGFIWLLSRRVTHQIVRVDLERLGDAR